MFIVLEGPDGAGTTLHTKLLTEKLLRNGRNVLFTAEPTSGSIGTWIRSELSKGSLPPSALQLLFCADRAEHVEKMILPALGNGADVVSDRYSLSTLAYGEATGVDRAWLKTINDGFRKPDITLVLLPSFAVCKERLMRRKEHDILEEEDLQKRVHSAYASLLDSDPTLVHIDSSGEKKSTSEHIWNTVRATLGL